MSEPLFNTLRAANRLPSPPAVAMRILQLVANEDTTLEELTHVISADPALTAKILKYLNSPLVGLGFQGTTLQEAVARIGTRGAQLLALSFTLVSQKHLQSCPSFDFKNFWSESLARAVAARHLATTHRRWVPDEAFIAGLVFRLGQLVLATAVPTEYEPVLRSGSTDGAQLVERERQAFGTDHLALGLQLLRHWKLPETVWGAMAPLAEPAPAADPPPPSRLLRLADGIAAFLARDEQQQGAVMEALVTRAAPEAGLDRDSFRPMLAQIGQDWIAYGQLLSIATGRPPDLDALEQEAEEHRTELRLAAELEVRSLRNENQQLSYLANRDRLTGLLNRGAFDEALAAGIASATARHGTLALLMLDLDRFKLINDRLGHPVGDAALRHLARILHTQLKLPAEAFRYGGEEFAVLAPDLGGAAALAVAETLRRAIADSPFTDGGRTIPLTASIGIAWAGWPDRPQNTAGLVAAADEQLYAAKQSGRNACRCTPA